MTVPLKGRAYLARRLELGGSQRRRAAQPARRRRRAQTQMALYAATGASFAGDPVVLLADQFSLEGGGHAEDLQDHDCAIAHSAP